MASAEEELRALQDRIVDAQQRQAAAMKQYNRVRTVCITAQQVLTSRLSETSSSLLCETASSRKNILNIETAPS